jgi:hypothetical protein
LKAILPKAMPQLDKLGKALTQQAEFPPQHQRPRGYQGSGHLQSRVVRAPRRGHQTLPLVDHFRMASQNLVTVGYGKQKLKNPANRLGPENRRVQIVNLASQALR